MSQKPYHPSKLRAALQPLVLRLLLFFVIPGLVILASCSSQPSIEPTSSPAAATVIPQTTPTVPTPSPSPFPYPPALFVGEQPIYQPEIDFAVRQIQSAITQLPGQSFSPEQTNILAIEDLIDQELLAQAAFQAGFTITDQELDTYITHLTSKVGQDRFNSWITGNAISKDLFVYALRRSLAAAWMRDFITSGLPGSVEQVHVRQVLVESIETAQQIIDQTNQPGVDFKTTAYAYDPYTGGDLGWIAPGTTFFAQLEKAIFNAHDLTRQQILAEPVHTPLGYHVLQVLARETRSLDRYQRLQYQQKAVDTWLAERRSSVVIDKWSVSRDPLPMLTLLSPVDGQPAYEVQDGDNYYEIAKKFRLPFQAIVDANPNYPPQYLSTGAKLVIPGVSGWSGPVAPIVIPAGTDLHAFSRAYGIDPILLARLNHLTSPIQMTYGSPLVLPQDKVTEITSHPLQRLSGLSNGQSLLEYAVETNLTPWAIALSAGSTSPNRILAGQDIYLLPSSHILTLTTTQLNLSSITLVQGQTTVINIPLEDSETQPTGMLYGMPLHFFSTYSGWTALQGMPAMGEPGTALLTLRLQPQGSHPVEFEQSLTFFPGEFLFDPPLNVDPATIDPGITAPEEQQISDLAAQSTPEKYWTGLFIPPVDSPGCTRSLFGNRRSFNGSPYIYFHSGLDYGVCGSDQIFAPAGGKVVFTGFLDVRGNATLIDHGWGVYSGFWHQSEILVRMGDTVSAGQVIGKIGATGRITGEHLHWELWVGGVQVDPLQWLEQSIP